MRVDRVCDISFSAGDPRPNTFTWVTLATNVPCNIQQFPTRYAIQKGITRGQNKVNVFIDASYLVGGMKYWNGIHLYDLSFLIEIHTPNNLSSKFSYIGSVVGIEANYIKFELGEFTGDISKVGGGSLPFAPTNPPISSVIHTTSVNYNFLTSGGAIGTYNLGGAIPVGAIPIAITFNPTIVLDSLGVTRVSLTRGVDILMPFTIFSDSRFQIVNTILSYWMQIAVAGGIEMVIDTDDLIQGNMDIIVEWVLP